jgi:2-methylcitrate dehydratase PrpD
MLDLEREILSDAIRRLYEAQAEGKITEQEREKLAASYKARMMSIKESISKDETIVALHDLEGMQEDLMKLFSERFGELTSKVDELRTKIDVKPIKEIPVRLPNQTPASRMEKIEDAEEEEDAEAGEEKPKKKRKPPEERPDAKTEAEKRIDSIRSEVEKVLDKLGQMEIES